VPFFFACESAAAAFLMRLSATQNVARNHAAGGIYSFHTACNTTLAPSRARQRLRRDRRQIPGYNLAADRIL